RTDAAAIHRAGPRAGALAAHTLPPGLAAIAAAAAVLRITRYVRAARITRQLAHRAVAGTRDAARAARAGVLARAAVQRVRGDIDAPVDRADDARRRAGGHAVAAHAVGGCRRADVPAGAAVGGIARHADAAGAA